MAFEVYRPRSSSENMVSITKHHIRLGNTLADKIKGERVEVAYDKDTNKMRIMEVAEGGMKISNGKIGASGVFKFFDIQNKKGSFKAEFNETENAIFVQLS